MANWNPDAHSSKQVRPNTSAGEMASGISGERGPPMFGSSGLMGGNSAATGLNGGSQASHSVSPFLSDVNGSARPSTSGHASSSSIGSHSTQGQMPGLSFSSNTSDAGEMELMQDLPRPRIKQMEKHLRRMLKEKKQTATPKLSMI